MSAKKEKRIVRRKVKVINDWGLHARPSAAVASEASKFESEITITLQDKSASALSVSALLILEAQKGSELTIEASGHDAEEAVQGIVNIFEHGFGETHVVLTGQGSECGTVIGTAHLLVEHDAMPHYEISKTDVANEKKRIRQAIKMVREEFKHLGREVAKQQLVREFQSLLLAVLKEENIVKKPLEYIEKNLINAEWALELSVGEIVNQFKANDHPVWQLRADEYNQVLVRLVAKMRLDSAKVPKRSKSGVKHIIVTNSVGPAEVLEYYKYGYVGFVTSSGSANSHAAILARGLGIPAIVALDRDAMAQIAEGDLIAIDSVASELHIKPGKQSLATLRKQEKQTRGNKAKRASKDSKSKGSIDTITKDGLRIQLLANVEFLEEIEIALRNGAEGIGLFRTEFVFIRHGGSPSEDEQYKLYSSVIKKLDGRPVTFRTLDIGHDKIMQEDFVDSPLGMRGIRHSMQEPLVFKNQLRALLRASRHGPMKILLPMVCQLEEFRYARQLLHDAAEEIGLDIKDLPELGAMIEIPGTVYILRELANECDFFSIGSNDLIQYMLAVDRNIAPLTELANPCHPGVVNMMSKIIRESGIVGIPVTLCGELAADPVMARLYCALGLRALSMNPAKIEETRDCLRDFSITRNSKAASEIAQSHSLSEVEELIRDFTH